ncbi:MAG: zinc ribbon domain-containing protein [Clostridiales bacterium]|nr:zinc ribbon domain-containing protein [Clostridiales bacterium]
MSFFENIGRSVNSARSRISLSARTKREVGKLNQQIAAKEKDLNAVYGAIGRSYYANHSQDAAAEEQDKFQQLQNTTAQLNTKIEEREWVKQVAKCPACGAVMHLDAEECVVCGAAMYANVSPEPQQVSCPFCGQVSLSADVCSNCGVNLTGYQNPVASAASAKAAKNTKIGLIAFISVLAAVALVVCLAVFGGANSGEYKGGKTPEKAVVKLIECIEDTDFYGCFECHAPGYTEYLMEEFDVSRSELRQLFALGSYQLKEELSASKGFKIKINSTSVEELDETDLWNIKEYYQEYYGQKVTDAKTVYADMTLIVPGEDDDTHEFTFITVKIDGKWWIDADSNPFNLEEFMSL